MEVGIMLLSNDKNNVLADKKYFLVNNNYYFLLPNADLLKISVFIFFDKTYSVLPSQKDGVRGNKILQYGEDHFLNFGWGEKSK